MILPSRRATFWRLLGLVFLVALGVSYARYTKSIPFAHGGSTMGIVYGVLATALVLILMAFGWRKRAYKSTWGTLDGWLQAHIYLGLVSVFVVLFHAGFRFRDKVATATGAVLVIVVLSGLMGAFLYTLLPRRLTRIQSNLAVEEISAQLNQTVQAIDRLATGRSTFFGKIADELVASTRPKMLAGWRLLIGSGRGNGNGSERWKGLLEHLPEEERPVMRQMLVLYRQHRELHRRLRFQQRYKNLLESWLYLHVPLSGLLLVLIAVHVVAVFYFGAV